MLSAEIIKPAELASRDRSAWQALRESNPAFQSPLLGPDFAAAVGRVRKDAAVAVYRWNGAAVGFLAHHRRPGGLARPMGAPFSDYQALIAEPGLSGAEALRLAGLREFRFSGLIDPHGSFGAHEESSSYAIGLPAGENSAVEFLETLRAGSAKRFKNLRRLDHKLEREVGEVALIGPDRSELHFDLLFAWKHAQFARSGLTDVFAPLWVQRLMRQLFTTTGGPLSGLMLTLMAGERPVGVHFGVREGDRYHPWAAAHDEELAAYSPGQLFLWRAVEAMPRLGLRWYDLSGGHDHYKLPFASETLTVMSGRTREALGWRVLKRAVGPGAARLQRRIEQIAATELTVPGRVHAFAQALAGSRRRAIIRAPGA